MTSERTPSSPSGTMRLLRLAQPSSPMVPCRQAAAALPKTTRPVMSVASAGSFRACRWSRSATR